MTDVPFWGPDFAALQSQDPEIASVILGELERLRGGLQLIASENFTSPAVLAALGSTLSNKYAEGYPGKRYYGGCAEVDKAEIIGIERAKELLRNTDLPVVDVALSSGFSSQSHLSHWFIRQVGVSPAVYRRQATS